MGKTMNESTVQQQIMIEAAKIGITLMRNNSGALRDVDGRVVRYGLMNESATRNKQIKSSDLIGITNTGRFIAIEVKAPGWKFSAKDQRANAQLAFINFIKSKGGIAGFCSSVLDFENLIRNS